MKKKTTTNVRLGAKCLARQRKAVLVLISKEEEADSWRKRRYFVPREVREPDGEAFGGDTLDRINSPFLWGGGHMNDGTNIPAFGLS
jgi:hypothetical protein